MGEVVNEHCQTRFEWKTYDEKIPKDDIVRLVKKIVIKSKDKWDHLIPLKKMGRKRHSRENMFALIIYAHMDNTREATKIYERIQYDDRYKFLLDGATPSISSIRDYRRLFEEVSIEIQKEILKIANEEGYTKYNHVITDGSPIKAYNSSENVISEENIDELQDMYTKCRMDKDRVDNLTKTCKKLFYKNIPYNEKMDLLETCKNEVKESNFNVTPLFDTDAKWMQNKKGYSMLGHNVQFVTDSETTLVVAIHVSNAGSDHHQLPPAMDKALENLPVKPKEVSADNAYRNEVTTTYLKKNEMEGYVPSTRQAKENKNNLSKNPFHKDNMIYNYDEDVFICYNKQKLYLQKTELDKNEKREKLGLPLEVKRTYYNKEACAECPYKEQCFSGNAKYRKVEDTGSKETLEIQKRMDSKEGKLKYRQRAKGESPIGTLRQQYGINEVPVTGSENVEKRLYWDIIGYNIKKIYKLGYPPV